LALHYWVPAEDQRGVAATVVSAALVVLVINHSTVAWYNGTACYSTVGTEVELEFKALNSRKTETIKKSSKVVT
jgi:hypothetical protein